MFRVLFRYDFQELISHSRAEILLGEYRDAISSLENSVAMNNVLFIAALDRDNQTFLRELNLVDPHTNHHCILRYDEVQEGSIVEFTEL